MRKIILTECQTKKLISLIILNEQNTTPFYDGNGNYWEKWGSLDPANRETETQKIRDYINSSKQKVINYFLNFYSTPESTSKFQNKNNVPKLKSLIGGIKIKINNTPQSSPNPNAIGYIDPKDPSTMVLNIYRFWTGKDSSSMYDVMLHEIGHSISLYLKQLGETPSMPSSPYYKPEDGKDSYVASDIETYTRIQRLRNILELKGDEDGVTILNKLITAFKSGVLKLPNYTVGKTTDNKYLVFKKIIQEKGMLEDLWKLFGGMTYNNAKMSDISALFAKYSQVQNGLIYTNINFIGKVNVATKGIH